MKLQSWRDCSTLPPPMALCLVILAKPGRAAFGMIVEGRWRVKYPLIAGSDEVVGWQLMPKPVRGWTLADVREIAQKTVTQYLVECAEGSAK